MNIGRNITLLTVSTLTAMVSASIVPALPSIAEAFTNIPYSKFLVKNLLSVHTLFLALFSPVFGFALDKYSRIMIIAISVAIFGIAGGSVIILPSLLLIFISRIFVGIGAAGIRTGVLAVMGDYFENKELDAFSGYQAAAVGIGAAIFYTLGGVLADINWRYTFIVYLSGLLLIPFILVMLPQQNKRKADSKGNSTKNREVQTKSKYAVHLLFALTFFGMLNCFVIPIQLPFYMDSIGMNKTQIGLVNSAMVAVSAVVALLYGNLRSRLSHFHIYSLFLLIIGASFIGLTYSENFISILLVMTVHGIGFGLLLPNSHAWLLSIAPANSRGKYSGGLTASFLLGQTLAMFYSQFFIIILDIRLSFSVIGYIIFFVLLISNILKNILIITDYGEA